MKRYAIVIGIAASSYLLTANASLGERALYTPIVDKTHEAPIVGRLASRFFADEVKPITKKKTRAQIEASMSPKHRRAERLLAGMLFGECRGQGIYCMTAVGHVAMNRARQDLDVRYGKGLWGVLNKRKAFSCLNKNDPNRKVIMRGLAGKIKPGTKDAERWKMAQDVAYFLMHRNEGDPTLGSTHYHATYMTPKWVKDRGMVKVTKIDGHIFYRKEG